jgi:hypothetical protein
MLVVVEQAVVSWLPNKLPFLGTAPLKLLQSCAMSVQQVPGLNWGGGGLPIGPQDEDGLALGQAQEGNEGQEKMEVGDGDSSTELQGAPDVPSVDPENGAEDDEADKVTAKCDDAEVKEELWNSYLWEAIQVPREC